MKNVVITGSNRGIGLQLAKGFIEKGDKVIATCRNPDSATELTSINHGGRLTVVQLEVIDSDSINNFIKGLSNQKVDVLINNAGIFGPKEQTIENLDPDQWLYKFAVNTIAPFKLATSLLPNLKASSNPRIVTISSQMGSLNKKNAESYAYCSSKAALNKVMQMLAFELESEGVVVCPVHPGWVRTEMGGSDADISVNESAEGLIELISNLSIKQSGQFLTWEGNEHPW